MPHTQSLDGHYSQGGAAVYTTALPTLTISTALPFDMDQYVGEWFRMVSVDSVVTRFVVRGAIEEFAEYSCAGTMTK